VIVWADVHNRLVLLSGASTGKRGDWVRVPTLQRAYKPMVKRIQLLMNQRLTSMMVLFNFLSKRITPLQVHARPAWLYTGVNDTTLLECSHELDLDPKVLDTMLGKLSPDPISLDFIIPPVACAPICLDQAT
jgi:hypothetical protein